ncbi:MAG: hypothetical protein WBF90_18090, partial [Rivularia sp. (in: cyanobacteria)]
MKRNFILSIGLSTLTTIIALSSSISPIFSQTTVENKPQTTAQVQEKSSQSDAVKFMCKEIFDTAGGTNIPATVAWVPKRNGHVRLIAWKSEY